MIGSSIVAVALSGVDLRPVPVHHALRARRPRLRPLRGGAAVPAHHDALVHRRPLRRASSVSGSSPGTCSGVGCSMVAIGLFLMSHVHASSGWTVLLPGFIVTGIGIGTVNPVLGLRRHQRRPPRTQWHGVGGEQHLPPGRHRHGYRRPRSGVPEPDPAQDPRRTRCEPGGPGGARARRRRVEGSDHRGGGARGVRGDSLDRRPATRSSTPTRRPSRARSTTSWSSVWWWPRSGRSAPSPSCASATSCRATRLRTRPGRSPQRWRPCDGPRDRDRTPARRGDRATSAPPRPSPKRRSAPTGRARATPGCRWRASRARPEWPGRRSTDGSRTRPI